MASGTKYGLANYVEYKHVNARPNLEPLGWYSSCLSEPGVSNQVGDYLKGYGVHSALVVTDRAIRDAGLLKGIFDSLEKASLQYVVFDDVAGISQPHGFTSVLRKRLASPDLGAHGNRLPQSRHQRSSAAMSIGTTTPQSQYEGAIIR